MAPFARTVLIRDLIETTERLLQASKRLRTEKQLANWNKWWTRIDRAWEELAVASRDGLPS